MRTREGPGGEFNAKYYLHMRLCYIFSHVYRDSNILSSTCSKMSKILFAFDFDRTLIDVNVDCWFIDLAATDTSYQKSGFTCWTDYMQMMFKTIRSRGYGKECILAGMDSIKISPSVKAACSAIFESDKADAIIISDANILSINRILEANGMTEMFKDVISNPAFFDSEGLLKIDYCQRDHGCPRCPLNLCKSKTLTLYKTGYDKVVYVGDGHNDICPSLSLTANDVVVAKKGLYLAKHVNDSGLLKATLHIVDFDKTLVETIHGILQ